MTEQEAIQALAQPLVPQAGNGIEGLTEGRIVHYVMDRDIGHRPAIIVRVWDKWSGCSNLQVFVDGSNDGESVEQGTLWCRSISHSVEPLVGTWHFIERA